MSSDPSRRVTGVRSRDQRGSTLVEALVALALFAVSASAIGSLLSKHIQMQGTNGTTTTAISLAVAELEDLRAMDYQYIDTRSSSTTVGVVTYQLSSTVQADTPADGMKTITTSVAWSEPSGTKNYTAYAIYTDVTR